ncbi:MAG: AAA family ATPase [Candidatus Aenigmatarchaeota archaeon]
MPAEAKLYLKKINEVKAEVHKAVMGQERVVEDIIICLICNAHALLEGVPGVAKTFTIRCLSEAVEGSTFSRIQFTPDLLPSDITGVQIYEEEKGFYIRKGPIFANFTLADEINRAPPKVQAAMLQCMAERQVTIGRKTFDLPNPFFVLATQNPLEQQGVYPLPEAQVDRFLFKINVGYPKMEAELKVIKTNAETKAISDYGIKKVLSIKDILRMQAEVNSVFVSEEIKEYATLIIDATRYPKNHPLKNGKYIRWGGSPRASISLVLAARANALINGRDYVMPDDIKSVAGNVLRHRIVLNYEGKAKNIPTDEIVEDILGVVEVV